MSFQTPVEALAPEDAACDAPRVDDMSRSERLRVSKRWRLAKFLRDRLIVVIIAIVISILIRTFLVTVFAIPSASMEPTLVTGDRIAVSRLNPGFEKLQRGDVVVFTDPGGWLPAAKPTKANGFVQALQFIGVVPVDGEDHVIKRVIGMPGDHVVCCDTSGNLTINDVSVPESFTQLPSHEAAASGTPFDVVVPDGKLWVMGDNRYKSADSRFHTDTAAGGFVPIANVTGRAFMVLWPALRFAVIPRLDNHVIPDPIHEVTAPPIPTQ